MLLLRVRACLFYATRNTQPHYHLMRPISLPQILDPLHPSELIPSPQISLLPQPCCHLIHNIPLSFNLIHHHASCPIPLPLILDPHHASELIPSTDLLALPASSLHHRRHHSTLEPGSSPSLRSQPFTTDLPHRTSSLEMQAHSAISLFSSLPPIQLQHVSDIPIASLPLLKSGGFALELPVPEAPSPPNLMSSIETILVCEDVYEIIDVLFSSTGFLG